MKLIYINGYQVWNWRKVRLYLKDYWLLIVTNTLATILLSRIIGFI